MDLSNQEIIFILMGFMIVVGLLWLGEYYYPLRNRKYSFFTRLITNALLSIAAFFIVILIVNPAQEATMKFNLSTNFGIVNFVDLPIFIEGIIAFLLMDLAFYYWHLLNHKIPFLWRFHNVHHIDPDLDFSSAFRFHFGEIAFSTIFRILQISIIGISPESFIIYEICFTANTIFQHSNIRLPIKIERFLNRIIVTPRMHGIHHSQIKDETNSNYSTVFPWWDIIHRTIRLNIPQSKINIGVPAYSKPEDNYLSNILLLPFKKQREYWKSTNNEFISIREESLDNNRLKLAE